jgi:hypothetical protein
MIHEKNQCKNCNEREHKVIYGEVIGKCKKCFCYSHNKEDINYFIPKKNSFQQFPRYWI